MNFDEPSYDKEGFNPKTGETVIAERKRIAVELDLPMKDAYDAFLLALL